MSKKLQNYFDVAKQQTPLLTEQEVAGLLHSSAKVVVKKRFLNLKQLVFMSTLSVIVTTLFLLWNNQHLSPNEQQATLDTQAVAPTSSINTNNLANKTTVAQQLKDTKIVAKPKLTATQHAPTNQTNYTNANWYKPASDNNYQIQQEPTREYFNENGELILTYEELAKLGIITDGNVLDYRIITDTPLTSIYDGVKKLETPIFTLHIESGGRNSLNGMTDTLKGPFFNKFFAIAIEDSVTDSKYPKHSFLKTELNISRGYTLDYFNELKPHLVPVAVELIYKNKTQHLVFWFKNEPDFTRPLPPPMAKAVEQRYGASKNASYFTAVKAKYRSLKPITKGLDSLTVAGLQKKMVHLNKESLKVLNITHDKKKIKLIFWESKTKKNKTIVSKCIYTNKGNYFSFLHQAWRTLNTSKGLQKVNNSPIAVTDYRMNNYHFLRNIDDSIGPFMDNPSYSFFARLAPQLHPIFLDSNNVFWFPNTYLTSKIIQESANQKAGLNLHKINTLVLTPEQLVKLKITYQADGIRIPSFDNGTQSIFTLHYNEGSSTELSGFNFKTTDSESTNNFEIDTSNKNVSIKITEKTTLPVPELVTDLAGIGWYQSALETEKFISKEEFDYMVKNNLSPLTYLPYINAVTKAKELLTKQLTTFVPIVLKHPSIKKTGVIAWYKPDSIFLSLLPLEVSTAIKQELNAITTNNKGASCTYFEACKELGINWEINAFPNPTERELNLSIENSMDSKYRIEITDIEGKIINDLSRDVKFPSGKHQLSYDISNLAKGIYLLQVINEKREILVKRIVKL